MTDQSCKRHQSELRQAACNSCGHGYCADCLIYVYGSNKPPLCVQCALAKSGIRTGARSPRKGWRERRREAKLRKATSDAVRAAREQAEQRAAGADLGGLHGISGGEASFKDASIGSWAAIEFPDERSA